jgi:hypothetical protein
LRQFTITKVIPYARRKWSAGAEQVPPCRGDESTLSKIIKFNFRNFSRCGQGASFVKEMGLMIQDSD